MLFSARRVRREVGGGRDGRRCEACASWPDGRSRSKVEFALARGLAALRRARPSSSASLSGANPRQNVSGSVVCLSGAKGAISASVCDGVGARGIRVHLWAAEVGAEGTRMSRAGESADSSRMSPPTRHRCASAAVTRKRPTEVRHHSAARHAPTAAAQRAQTHASAPPRAGRLAARGKAQRFDGGSIDSAACLRGEHMVRPSHTELIHARS